MLRLGAVTELRSRQVRRAKNLPAAQFGNPKPALSEAGAVCGTLLTPKR